MRGQLDTAAPGGFTDNSPAAPARWQLRCSHRQGDRAKPVSEETDRAALSDNTLIIDPQSGIPSPTPRRYFCVAGRRIQPNRVFLPPPVFPSARRNHCFSCPNRASRPLPPPKGTLHPPHPESTFLSISKKSHPPNTRGTDVTYCKNLSYRKLRDRSLWSNSSATLLRVCCIGGQRPD